MNRGSRADQIFAAALDVDLGDGLIAILALVGITFLLIITLGVLSPAADDRQPGHAVTDSNVGDPGPDGFNCANHIPPGNERWLAPFGVDTLHDQ